MAALAVVALLAILWSVAPFGGALDAATLDRWRAAIRDRPLAPFAAVAGYVALGVVAAPATAMIGATMLLFGARVGVLVAFAGMLANGLATYGVARWAARDAVDAWLSRRAGSKLDALNRVLARRGFVAVTLMRLTPTPYTLQNVLAGAARIALVPFVLGTAIGIAPVIALMAGLTTGLDAWGGDDARVAVLPSIVLLALAVVAIVIARRAVRNRVRR